jgi:hypothetical protein
VRIVRQGALQVEADLEIVHQGRLWLRADTWTDQRFATDDKLWEMIRYPEHNTLVYPVAGLADACRLPSGFDGAGLRDLMARRYLTGDERRVYRTLDFRTQVSWLSERVVAKDLARQMAWAAGSGPLFPVELQAREIAPGRLGISGPSGEQAVAVDVDGGAALARAVAGDAPQGVGVARLAEGSAESEARARAARRAAAAARGRPFAAEMGPVEAGDGPGSLRVDGLEVRVAVEGGSALAWTPPGEPS